MNEGEASIFRPENGSYKLVARLQMDEWLRIATAKVSLRSLVAP